MLEGTDKQTFHSIRLLVDSVKESKKPLLFWVGAGASAWCNYPLWDELANIFHSQFLKYEANYNKAFALGLLELKKYPDFFQLCQAINRQRYFSILADSFKPQPPTPVYKRFIETLRSIKPLHILTTNIDECLEKNIGAMITVQRSDLERCVNLLQNGESFVSKLHGSVSSIESIVFTADEYAELVKDNKYLSLIRHIFSETILIFVGYGLGDDYVLDLLSCSEELKNIFGDGPHFAVLPGPKSNLPQSVNAIRYKPEPYRDHRTAIQVVDEIRCIKSTSSDDKQSACESLNPNKIFSVHLVSDVHPPGTWESSVTLQIERGNDLPKVVIIGHGISNSELPHTNSTAMHDLIVGLLCFDIVYAPLSSLSRVHVLLGSDIFWEFVKNEYLRFIEWKSDLGIIYPSTTAISGGELASIFARKKDGSERTIPELIRKHLLPVPGKEKVAEELFESLESKIEVIDRPKEPHILNLVRGLLLRPSIRNLLGMSGGVLPTSIPRWMMYPVLRLAHVVRIGAACQLLGIASTKLEFGSAGIAGPAFAAASGAVWSDELASYVLSGRFDTDLGKFVIDNPEVLHAIMKFRDTEEGIRLRKEILEQLSLSLGSDFIISINAGLRSIIPPKVLQEAHDKLAGLMLLEKNPYNLTPALWNNPDYANKALALWRKRSAQELKEYCEKNHVSNYDLCPCGSGEKLRFCCEEASKI